MEVRLVLLLVTELFVPSKGFPPLKSRAQPEDFLKKALMHF